ncbi:unnamed protein product, partial [Scytosiphon promiscuus]
GGLPVAASVSAGAAVAGEASAGRGDGYGGDMEKSRSNGRRVLPESAQAAAGGGEQDGGPGYIEGMGSDLDASGKEERDWHGTSSDAFEIAVAVLKRCREDSVLVEALPDTLELLLRACMEGLNIAGERAKRESYAAPRGATSGGSVNGARQAGA